MQYQLWASTTTQEAVNSAFTSAMGRVYLWMTGGLGLTTVVALAVANNPGIQQALFSSNLTVFGLIGAQFGLVVVISLAINKMAPSVALGLFFLYAGLTGLTLSTVFLVYDLGTIGLAFGAAASLFAGLSLVGMTTRKDLTRLGPMLLASLLGLIVASVANWFLQSTLLEWVVSLAGVIIFAGLTVYDSKKIKEMTSDAVLQGDTLVVQRVGIMGALKLYLDFLNLFMFILRLAGGRK
ncbi:MAG TPA: Bax inhibitor-1/YccA family protein [Dehalococcoidia bacterium]|nr:Bax inhibitor-1/YccA family protein [Dehalococcoidia bacterium]